MARKDKNFQRKVMPYLLLAFGLIGALLILLELFSNVPQDLGGLLEAAKIDRTMVVM